MDRKATVLGTITQVFGFGAILAAGGGFVLIRIANQMMLTKGIMPSTAHATAISVSIITLGVYHILSIIALFSQHRSISKFRSFRSLSIALGIVSLILTTTNPVMLQEVGKEFVAGFSSPGEWTFVTVNFAIHSVYVLTSLAVLSFGQQIARSSEIHPEVGIDETMFVTVNFTGAFSGWTGLLFLGIAGLTSLWQPAVIDITVPIFSAIICAPFALSLIVWIIERIRRGAVWDDEKQETDVHRASFIAIVCVFGLAFVLYCIQLISSDPNSMTSYWFPLIIFTFISVSSSFLIGMWSKQLKETI